METHHTRLELGPETSVAIPERTMTQSTKQLAATMHGARSKRARRVAMIARFRCESPASGNGLFGLLEDPI